ncbi:hypothetical protein [Chryseobacterium gallinarum]|uniref:Lipoprotein n=1 Tax=Chryseobacterium gallinarum TaxID=1324352 RepID=A0ABX6KVN2_CHRGL|nr:hypothetical protein [Chryseobacterium gallinarum]QIY91898.1 hypothetical protein FOB44_15110 [Chryseobacterium gallinarum]
MKKHLRLKMLLLAVISLFLYSCMHDETTAESEASYLTKEYTSKSLWKEDEKYIKNVKKIFEANADPEYFKNKHGEVAWNYALTTGEESLLEVPVIKNGKIHFTLVVKREGNRVYFKTDPNEKSKNFFEILMFKDRKNLSGSLKETSKDPQARSACITITKTVTWTDTVTGEVLQIDHFTETRCSPVGPYLDCTDLSLNSSCGSGSGGDSSAGGGGGGGYPYTQEEQELADYCKLLREQRQNTSFQNNLTNLKNNTALKKETGYIQRTNGSYTYQDAATQTEDKNSLSLPNASLQANKDIMGYLHTHVDDYTFTNTDGDEEIRKGIKMFSPADVAYFMNMLKNAQDAGRPLSDVYAVMVTSKGNYEIRFTGNQYQLKTFTDAQVKVFRDLYKAEMIKSTDLELTFLRFISEKMNVKAVNLYKMDDSNATNYEIRLTPEKNKMTTGCAGL